jgi:AAA15 family ATPase/GTPase
MLIEFKVRNFRSFRDWQSISMVADTFSEHRDTNTFDPKLKGFGRLVRSAAIYGPNAAGKTNLLRAIQFMQSFVVHSAATTTEYPYTPYKFTNASSKAASEFQITIVQNGVRYEYGFTMGPERVEQEWLIEYANPRGRAMFHREYEKKKKSYTWKFSPFLKGQRTVWSETTRPEALFISTAVQLNSTQLLPVFEWFQKRLVAIVGPTTMNQSLTLRLLEQPEGKERLLPFLREADLGISDLTVSKQPVPAGGMVINPTILEQQPGMPAINAFTVTLSHMTDDLKNPVALKFDEESHGTQTLFKTAGAWINVMTNGEVLLFDEIDSSLHPLLSRFLIQRFHSQSTNPHNAQLIFSTHDTSLLDRKLFRRDQIWFVEKERDGVSKLFPLTDFKPRKDESLEHAYMRGRYGALPILPIKQA